MRGHSIKPHWGSYTWMTRKHQSAKLTIQIWHNLLYPSHLYLIVTQQLGAWCFYEQMQYLKASQCVYNCPTCIATWLTIHGLCACGNICSIPNHKTANPNENRAEQFWLAKLILLWHISLYIVLNLVTCSVIFWELTTTNYHNIMHILLFPGNGWLQHSTANGRYPSRQGPGEPRATPPSTKGPYLCSPGLCWGEQGTCMQQWPPHWLWISRWLLVL